MKRILCALLMTIGVALLAACSSENAALKPAPIPKFKSTLHVSPLWARHVGNGALGYYLLLTPVVVGDKMYVASYDGILEALYTKTGHLIWETRANTHYSSGLAADNGMLYVTTDDAHLLAIEQSSGRVQWSIPLSTQALATPQVSNGIILVHAIDATLTAYSTHNGHQLWRYKESLPDLVLRLSSQPQIVDNNVVCGFANGKVVVLNLMNGQVLWTHQVAEPQGATVVERMVDVDSTPVVTAQGMIYVVDFQGNLQALNMSNGNVVWEHKLSAYAGLAADNEALYVTDAQSTVWSFDEQTGTVLWKQTDLSRRGLTAPTIVGNALAIADQQGYVFWVSLNDGHFLGMTHEALGSILVAPINDQQSLYVYSTSGRLMAYKVK